MLPREPERCKTETAWFRRLGRCCTKDLFVSGPGRTACPGGHACGGTAPAVFRRLCRRNVRPPFRCTQAPCRRGPGPILFFRGAGNDPAPKNRRICLAHPAGKAILCPLHNAPESARKDHYCGEPPPGIQRISACFNTDRCKKLPSREKSIHILPKHKTDAFRNMQKASAVKNYFNLRQS